jgi:methylphosphotriester-DNA--protein-cysteine methyltransferase
MRSLRRIDWSEILEPDAAAAPVWREDPAPSDLVDLLLGFEDLFTLQDPDALFKRAVELALDPVGLMRAGVYLYDESLDLMRGTWGTDLRRRVVDEHHAMFQLNEPGRRVFARAVSGQAHWTVVEDCPIIVHDARETRVVGRAWAVCTPIRSARARFGMLYNDPGLTGSAVDPAKQTRAALLCAAVALALEGMRGARKIPPSPHFAGSHSVVAKAVRMLAEDPSLSGAEIAAALEVSPSRFARVFKAKMGMSLVDHRNHLRLERFFALIESGSSNLLAAALQAGFGSYAQFHRVFHAVRGMTPRVYLASRGATKAP